MRRSRIGSHPGGLGYRKVSCLEDVIELEVFPPFRDGQAGWRWLRAIEGTLEVIRQKHRRSSHVEHVVPAYPATWRLAARWRSRLPCRFVHAAEKKTPVIKAIPRWPYPHLSEKKVAGKSDEAAIRATERAFVEASNRGDAGAVASLTPQRHTGRRSGKTFRGRKAIEAEYAASSKQHPGVKMEVAVQSIELPAPGRRSKTTWPT